MTKQLIYCKHIYRGERALNEMILPRVASQSSYNNYRSTNLIFRKSVAQFSGVFLLLLLASSYLDGLSVCWCSNIDENMLAKCARKSKKNVARNNNAVLELHIYWR